MRNTFAVKETIEKKNKSREHLWLHLAFDIRYDSISNDIGYELAGARQTNSFISPTNQNWLETEDPALLFSVS